MGAQASHESLAEGVQRSREQGTQPIFVGVDEREMRQTVGAADEPGKDRPRGATREGRKPGGDPGASQSWQIHQVQRGAMRIGSGTNSTISGSRSVVDAGKHSPPPWGLSRAACRPWIPMFVEQLGVLCK